MDRMKEVDRAADAVAKAVAKHFRGDVDVYVALGALSTIAADIISKCPKASHAELLAAWDESPSWVRQSLLQKSAKN